MNVVPALLRTLLEALQIALVVALTIWLAPKSLLPPEFGWVVDVFTSAIIALIVVGVRLLAFPRARLEVTWTRTTDAQQLRELEVVLNPDTKHAAPLTMSVERTQAWGFGWVALKLAVRRGLSVRARAAHARTALIPDDQRDFEDMSSVIPESGFSVRLQLRDPIQDAGLAWNEVEVTPRGFKKELARRRRLRHQAVVDGRLGFVLGWFIAVDCKASVLNERWS